MASSRKKSRGPSKLGERSVKEVPKPWRLHCFCKREKDAGWTITCANCEKWYHGDCISFPRALIQRIDKLYCRRCESHYRLKSSFLPKCRLETCELAAEVNSEYCSPEHRIEFWRQSIDELRQTPARNAQILKWIAQRCSKNPLAFNQATPYNLPRPPKSPNAEVDSRLQRLQDALSYREEHNVCGFDRALLDTDAGRQFDPNNACKTNPKECHTHKNWPEMVRKRIELVASTPEERAEPDPAWLAKRAKFLVAGTTRYSRRKGWKAAYFIPYVWEDDNVDYFIDNNPEPFWDKHF